MKKLLSILTAVSISSSAALAVVSCGGGNNSDPTSETYFPGGDGSISAPISNDYKVPYNYQTGSSASDGDNLNNEFITSFNGSAESTYSSYNIPKGFTMPEFNGNKELFLKTSDKNFSLTGWMNDDIQFQNVLYLKKDLHKYKNIKIQLEDKTQGISDDAKLIGVANFEKYMLTNTYSSGLDKGIPSKEEIQNVRQYVPDAILKNELETPFEEVDPSSDKDNVHVQPKEVGFDLWNIWCSLKTPDNKSAVGKHDVKLTISFEYDGKKQSYGKGVLVDVKNHRYNSGNDYDQNGDGKVDQNDSFGFSAGTFPTRSQKFWSDGKYKNIPNYDVVLKKGQSTYNSDIEENNVLYGKNDLVVNPAWVSNGSNCDLSISGNKALIKVNPSNPDFMSFYEVYENNKLLATYSVYYNENGTTASAEAYNAADDDGGKNVSVDVNGDGKITSDDWDVNGDGKYTQEDWASAGLSEDGVSKDQIGPNANYANFVMNSGKSWSEFDSSLKPLKDTNSMFLRGNGYQEANNNQLIQVSGNLVDKSYNKNEWSGFEQKAKEINDKYDNLEDILDKSDEYPDSMKPMIKEQLEQQRKEELEELKKTSPMDDYESALKDTADDIDKITKFFNSDQSHKWNWKFNFSGLDSYMREAAKNDMYQVLINPIDAGASFNFWYLKDDNKIGPLRTINQKMVDANSGMLTDWGKVYLKNIFPEFIKQLSEHMDSLKNDPSFMTKDRGMVKVYIQFDEDNEKMVDEVMNVVHANSSNIYSSVYLGWRSDIDGIPAGFWKYLQRDFSNNNMDQIVINYDRVLKNVKNKGLNKFADMVKERNLAGKTTMIYTAFVERPGLFAASDLSAAYWNMFFNFRLGTNGYVRWGYDFLYNDYFKTATIEPNRESGFSSGESYLEYSGEGDQVHYSTRLLALVNAEHYVNKAKQILFSKDGSFSDNEKNMVRASLKTVGIDNNSYIFDNNDYKYNIKTIRPSEYAIPSDDKYTVTVPKQIYGVVKTIDWID